MGNSIAPIRGLKAKAAKEAKIRAAPKAVAAIEILCFKGSGVIVSLIPTG